VLSPRTWRISETLVRYQMVLAGVGWTHFVAESVADDLAAGTAQRAPSRGTASCQASETQAVAPSPRRTAAAQPRAVVIPSGLRARSIVAVCRAGAGRGSASAPVQREDARLDGSTGDRGIQNGDPVMTRG
jgi:hypothetical protein